MLDHASSPAPRDIVLVHGAGGNKLLWRRTTGFLTGGSKAIAIDLPGHPEGAATCRTVEEYAEALHGFMAENGLAGSAVCGHSMGSAIALSLAVNHPEDAGALILVSSGAKLGVDPKIVEGLRAEPLKTIERVITPRSYYKIDLGLGREARATLSFSNLPVFLNDYLACDGFDVRKDLPGILQRTLVVCGERDTMTPPKWSQYLKDNIPNSELKFIQDAGHMLPLEKPEELAGLIAEFLDSLSP